MIDLACTTEPTTAPSVWLCTFDRSPASAPPPPRLRLRPRPRPASASVPASAFVRHRVIVRAVCASLDVLVMKIRRFERASCSTSVYFDRVGAAPQPHTSLDLLCEVPWQYGESVD